MPRFLSHLTVLLVATLPACDGVPDLGPAPGPDPMAGGVLATFRVAGTGPDGQPFDERFRVWVTNPTTIDDILQIQAGVNPNRFPSGGFRAGPGTADHNLPWSWHLDPDDVAMVEVAIEVCDGRPSIVEQSVADYLQLGLYCPWGARLDSVEDRR